MSRCLEEGGVRLQVLVVLGWEARRFFRVHVYLCCIWIYIFVKENGRILHRHDNTLTSPCYPC
jgi:hypothetical protein